MGRLAPEKMMRAGLLLLYRATAQARNLALDVSTPHKKLEDLMDAIHHLPEILADWDRFDESILHLHLDTYDRRWSNNDDPFSLRLIWEDGLRQFHGTESI